MSNQIAAACAALIGSVDWTKEGFDPQSVIDGMKTGKLRGPLTDWLARRGWEEATAVQMTGRLKALGSVSVAAIGAKPTSECFVGQKRFCYRDGDLDSWLPEVQTEMPACDAAIGELIESMTFIDMFQDLFGTSKHGVAELSGMIIEKGTFALPQIESLIERSDAGEDVKLRTDGYANLFPVISKDGKTVSVVGVDRDGGGRWRVRVVRLGYGGYGWDAGDRLFSRN